MATFDAWLDAYDIVYRTLPAASDAPCPNCGHRTLVLVFTAPRGMDYGYASFWCDTCLQGVHISRAPIPDGVVARLIDGPPEGRRQGIPAYELVT